jgi:quercetin dioxygenase-like cupin family protein
MNFWERADKLNLQEFRPGILSQVEFGEGLTMACMKIDPEMEDKGHQHPFDQCGIVLEGEIEMFIENDRRILKKMDAYFIPSGIFHGWRTYDTHVRLLDVSSKST